jgi:hypothetical protein
MTSAVQSSPASGIVPAQCTRAHTGPFGGTARESSSSIGRSGLVYLVALDPLERYVGSHRRVMASAVIPHALTHACD